MSEPTGNTAAQGANGEVAAAQVAQVAAAAAQGAAVGTAAAGTATAGNEAADTRFADLERRLAESAAVNKKLQDENAQRRIQGKAAATLEERLAEMETNYARQVQETANYRTQAALTGKVADAKAAAKLLDADRHYDAEGNVKLEEFLNEYPFMRVAVGKPSLAGNPGTGGIGGQLTPESIGAMSQEEYEKRRPEIMAAMATGKVTGR